MSIVLAFQFTNNTGFFFFFFPGKYLQAVCKHSQIGLGGEKNDNTNKKKVSSVSFALLYYFRSKPYAKYDFVFLFTLSSNYDEYSNIRFNSNVTDIAKIKTWIPTEKSFGKYLYQSLFDKHLFNQTSVSLNICGNFSR